MDSKKRFNYVIRKLPHLLILILAISLFEGCAQSKTTSFKSPAGQSQEHDNQSALEEAGLKIARLVIAHDEDGDGKNDLEDILEGARSDARNKPGYRSAYYSGGYPPDDEGVCTDTIWRALKSAGYNLKDMVDMDIKTNTGLYDRVNGRPDPNIDFRRVPNLATFFKRHATLLAKEIVPNDVNNLREWQGGDIVVFGKPLYHIAVVSDMRRKDGVPYIIHNSGPYTQEEDMLLYWHENVSPIIYHFRFPKVE